MYYQIFYVIKKPNIEIQDHAFEILLVIFIVEHTAVYQPSAAVLRDTIIIY